MPRALISAIASICLVATNLAAQTISDRIRDVKAQPERPQLVMTGISGDVPELSLEALTKQADLVIEARTSLVKTYINAADTYVFTDFAVIPTRTLAGKVAATSATPGGATGIVVRQVGGEVVKEGVTVQSVDHMTKLLKNGGQYLIFLKKFGKEPGVYAVLNSAAFEITATGLNPMAYRNPTYKEFTRTRYSELIPRIMTAAMPAK